jgi:transposase InsO family protein
MNTELKLYSISRRKKKNTTTGEHHKTFDNLLKRNFEADAPNEKWCVDFTYLFLQNGNKRYNCTIIDLYDRSVVASVTGKEITAELAKKALSKAMKDNPKAVKSGVILHSDQGSQFTSNEFVEACNEYGVRQSMSRAGCPYDNAPMERYFNTLKNELIYHYSYVSDDKLNEAVSDFAYVWYNHVRPHSYNGGLTPMQKRKSHSSVYAAKAA